MSAEFDAWVKKMAEEAGDDNVKNALNTVLAHEKVANSLKSGYMAHSDYTRKTQELASKKADLEEKVVRLQQWYDSEAPKNVRLVSDLEKTQRELQDVKDR